MMYLFGRKDQMPIPHKLDECCEADNTTKELLRIANLVETWGGFILVGILILGVVFSIITGYIVSDISYDVSPFAGFVPSFVIWLIAAVIEFVTYHLLALAIRALASLVQSTRVTANVALYNAYVKEHPHSNDTKQETATKTQSAPNTASRSIREDMQEPPIKTEPAPKKGVNSAENEPVKPIVCAADRITCPVCHMEQNANRKVCWNCNQTFEN